LIPELLEKDISILNRPFGGDFNIDNIIAEVHEHYLPRALNEANNNKVKAAKLLGFKSYQTLGDRIKKYEIE